MNKQNLTEKLKEEFYSPYKVSQIESELRNVKIPPQKLYGYVRQGYIKHTINSTGKIQISKDEVVRYLLTQKGI